MAEIIGIKKRLEYKNPDIFINEVLNDPARLARLKAKRAEELEKAKKERELAEQKLQSKLALETTLTKVCIICTCLAICFVAWTVGF